MKLLKSKYALIDGSIVNDIGIAFEKKIVEIDDFEKLLEKFPEAQIVHTKENSLLMAGLINPHVHIEYSHHSTQYNYGSYIDWLNSIVKNFVELSSTISEEKMEKALNTMIKSGTTSIGAISSNGFDFDVLKASPLRKVVFNEIIASQPHQVDQLFSLFKSRLSRSEELKDERFIPALAIHSPFSVHYIVVKKIVEIAKKNGYLLSTHFMESFAEREWLDKGVGEFKNFYMQHYGKAQTFTDADRFLNEILNTETIFVHGVYLNYRERELIKNRNGTLVHCPVSNRLLGNDLLDIDSLDRLEIDWSIATDGMSSNFSLNLFDELRTALFMHNKKDLESFSFQLLKSVTEIPAKQLKLNSGKIEVDRDSDLILIDLGEEEFDRVEKIPLHLILKGYPVYKIFILGEEVEI